MTHILDGSEAEGSTTSGWHAIVFAWREREREREKEEKESDGRMEERTMQSAQWRRPHVAASPIVGGVCRNSSGE
jgi:hypothetical protein